MGTVGDSKVDIVCCDRDSSPCCSLTSHLSLEEPCMSWFPYCSLERFSVVSSIQERLAER